MAVLRVAEVVGVCFWCGCVVVCFVVGVVGGGGGGWAVLFCGGLAGVRFSLFVLGGGAELLVFTVFHVARRTKDPRHPSVRDSAVNIDSTWKVAFAHPKVATRKRLPTPNNQSNPKRKDPERKVATYASPKVAT